jgi:hypothetical protein
MPISQYTARSLAEGFNNLSAITYGYQFDRLAAGLEEAINRYNMENEGNDIAPKLTTQRYENGPYCEKHIGVYCPDRPDAIFEIRLFKDGAISKDGTKLDARFDYESERTVNDDGTTASSAHGSRFLKGFDEINEATMSFMFVADGLPTPILIQRGEIRQYSLRLV